MYVYIFVIWIYFCVFTNVTVFLENKKVLPDLRFSQRCCCVFGYNVSDVSADRVTGILSGKQMSAIAAN